MMAGHFSHDRTLDRVKRYAWWPEVFDSVSTYCQSCRSCHLAKHPSGKRPGLLMKIDHPFQPWNSIHMDFVTSLPLAGPLGYDAVLVIGCRLTKCIRLIPTHANVTAKLTALRLTDRVLPTAGLPRIIISDQDPKFSPPLGRPCMPSYRSNSA